jgi:hypothetical protein
MFLMLKGGTDIYYFWSPYLYDATELESASTLQEFTTLLEYIVKLLLPPSAGITDLSNKSCHA